MSNDMRLREIVNLLARAIEPRMLALQVGSQAQISVNIDSKVSEDQSHNGGDR